MNILRKIGIANKLIDAYKEVCSQSELNKEIATCIQNIVIEIKKLQKLCPKVKTAYNAILKEVK